jgi:3-oxoacyl-[acyl-carrier-protein] synthase-3
MKKGRIVGTGSTTPKRILTNQELETIVDTTDEWITRRTGIKERRISSDGQGENTSDLSTSASLKALEMAGISPDSLDMIVIGTVTADRQFPSAACMVQKALNASRAVAFDLSAGCSGFLYVLTPTTGDDGILSTHLESDGSFWDLLYSTEGVSKVPEILDTVLPKPYYLKMEGNRLFKKAVSCLCDIAISALAHNGLSGEDITLMVPHQANLRIIRAAAEKLSIPMEKVYTNIEKYGNTSSASIPIALNEANREGLLKAGDFLLMVTFGAGLTWGASVVNWSS